MRLPGFILAFCITTAVYSQSDEVFHYRRNKKDIKFTSSTETISLRWRKAGSGRKELTYQGFSKEYKLMFRGNHPTVLYRGADVVANFRDLDILVDDKIYHYGEGIPEHWVFMVRDTVVVDCRYEETRDDKFINFHYANPLPEDLEILKVLALKRGNEVAKPRDHIPIIVGGAVTIGLAGALIYTFANR
jgi:hypothetical protein